MWLKAKNHIRKHVLPYWRQPVFCRHGKWGLAYDFPVYLMQISHIHHCALGMGRYRGQLFAEQVARYVFVDNRTDVILHGRFCAAVIYWSHHSVVWAARVGTLHEVADSSIGPSPTTALLPFFPLSPCKTSASLPLLPALLPLPLSPLVRLINWIKFSLCWCADHIFQLCHH